VEVVLSLESDLNQEELNKKLKCFEEYKSNECPIKTEIVASLCNRYLVEVKSNNKELFYFGKHKTSKIDREIKEYLRTN